MLFRRSFFYHEKLCALISGVSKRKGHHHHLKFPIELVCLKLATCNMAMHSCETVGNVAALKRRQQMKKCWNWIDHCLIQRSATLVRRNSDSHFKPNGEKKWDSLITNCVCVCVVNEIRLVGLGRPWRGAWRHSMTRRHATPLFRQWL